MFRHCLLALIFMNICPLLATAQQTPTPNRQWRQIASLPPGSQLLVRQVDERYSQPCTLAWIDNTALACDIFVPATGPRRVVYPIASVTSVTQQAPPSYTRSDTHPVALFVGMAVGGTVGGIAASNSGVRAGIVGGVLGSLAGGGIGWSAASSFNPRPQPQFSVRIPLRAPRIPVGCRHF